MSLFVGLRSIATNTDLYATNCANTSTSTDTRKNNLTTNRNDTGRNIQMES